MLKYFANAIIRDIRTISDGCIVRNPIDIHLLAPITVLPNNAVTINSIILAMYIVYAYFFQNFRGITDTIKNTHEANITLKSCCTQRCVNSLPISEYSSSSEIQNNAISIMIGITGGRLN